MTQPWKPEIEVTPELALELIQTQFSEFERSTVREFGVGWDNIAYLVDDRYVFRFPQRQMGADCMESELSILPAIKDRLTQRISAAEWVGQRSNKYPWRFGGYAVIPGNTACHADLDDSARKELVAPLASFLKALHAITATEAFGLGAETDEKIRRLDFSYRLKRTEEVFAKLKAADTFSQLDKLRPILEPIQKLVAEGQKTMPSTCIVHGDLYARHAIIGEHRDFAGVIDWGDVHCGHPAVDLAFAHTFLPADAITQFYEIYGRVPLLWQQVARFRGLYHDAVVLNYANEIGDIALARESTRSLFNLLAGC